MNIKRYKKYSFLSLLSLLGFLQVEAQVNVTATGGTPSASYATVNAAFTAINAATHTGVITITVAANTTEPATPVPLLASGTAGSSYTSVTIKPSGNVIINSPAAPTANRGIIELAGADNVTIDGDDPATPGTQNLSIVSATTTTAGVACVRLSSNSTTGTDGANNITVKNCIITGARSSATSTTVSYGIEFSNGVSTNTTSTGAYSSLNTVISNNVITRCYYGIYAYGNSTSYYNTGTQILNNTIGSSTAANNVGIYGIYLSYSSSGATGAAIIEGNDVQCGDYATGFSANVAGIYLGTSANSVIVRRNNIHDVCNGTINGWGAHGINIASSNTGVAITNNFIRDIAAQNYSSSLTTSFQNYGIYIASTSTGTIINNNTIYLNKPNLTTYGTANPHSSCICFVSTSTLAQMLNNILVNNQGAASTNAYCITTYATSNISGATVNNNAYYTVANGKVGYYSAGQATMTAWQSATSKDANGFFTNPPLISTTDMHLTAGSASQFESGGAATAVTGVTTDIDGQTRPGPAGSVNGGGTAPDVGADEFDGTPISPPSVSTATASAISCTSATSHTITATVVANSGTISGVVLNYNNGAAGSVAMTLSGGTSANGTWTGTIPAAAPGNTTVTWSLTATSSFGLTANYTGTPYTDIPLTGASAVATATKTNLCSGAPDTLSATVIMPGASVPNGVANATLGVSGSSGGLSPFSQYYEAQHTQYLLLASDLAATGLGAGDITALSFNVTSKLSSKPFTSYTIKIATTNVSNLTALLTPAFSTVYTSATTVGAGYNSVSGQNTFTFTSPFNWDGISNIVLDVCFANDPASTGTYYTDNDIVAGVTKAYTATYGYYADNANLCGVTGSNLATSNILPLITFTGVKSFPVSAISWSNGSTTVGTTNPLVVNPTTVTTYTASATAMGCPVTSNGVTVNIIPLPAGPSATNSSQCGLGVPAASVSGATGSNTYLWYSAATGGTLLQTGGTTYTTAISTTTTFYVAIFNGTCESIRTPVTVTVTSPDAVTATASNTNTCANMPITLTATKAAGPNVYTYSWTASPATGSGIPTSVSGATPSITPTLPGTYIYTVVGTGTVCTASGTVTVTVKASPTNITATASASTLCAGGNFNLAAKAVAPVTLISENFNAATNNWVKTNTSSGGSAPASLDWTLRPNGYTYASVVFNSNDNSQFYQSNADAAGSGVTTNTTLQSPVFSTMGLDTVTLKFFHYFKYYSGATNDSATIEVSTNGTSWTPVQTFKGADAGAPTAFSSVTVNLNSYANQPTMYVRFHYTSGWGFYWSIDNVTVTGNGGSWAWTSTPAGFTSGAQNPANVSPAAAGSYTYTATITNGVGCSASATTTAVVVNPLPTITFTPATAAVCAGSGVAITASGANIYSWSPATGLSAATGATVTATPTATVTYTVTGTSTAGCVNTATKLVTVNPLPVVSVSPSAATTICAGSSVTLTASGADTYSWSPATGLSAATGTSVTASPATTTTYTVTGTDVNGCSASTTKLITVNPIPTVTVAPATTTTVCAGTSVTLTAGGATTYSWSPSTGLSATTGATVVATPTTTTTYTVTGDDGSGCTANATKTITINPLPNVSISPTTTTTICEGSSVSLTASGANTYSWSPATGLSATTGANVVASPITTTTYIVTGTGANGCTNTATKTVNVNAAPVISVSPTPANMCAGGNVTLIANGANTYSWSPATGLSATTGASVIASPANTVTYTVTGTGTNGCTATATKQVTVNAIPVVTITPATAVAICAGNSVTLTGNGATTYSWAPATGLSATTGASVVASPTSTITYTVTGTTNGCSAQATKLVTVNPLPTAIITAAGNTNFCQGGSVTFNANTGTGLTYNWRRNGTAIGVTTASYTATTAGTYDVIISNGTCPATSNSFTVIVSTPPAPVITASGSTSICQGTSVTLNTDPNAAYTYQWQLNGVNISGANNSSHAASAAGSYAVVVTNGTCVVTSAPVAVVVNQLPAAAVLPQGATTFCEGGAVPLFASINVGYSYQWYFNSTPITGANSAVYIATDSGNYSVMVSDANCSATAPAIAITVIPLPGVPAITTNGLVMTTGVYITYQWYRNGILIPGATGKTYTATADGNYTVVVTNYAGCQSTSAAQVISSVGVTGARKTAVTMYPNPATTMIHIDAGKAVDVSISSVDGKEVMRKTNAVDVDIHLLADGVYMVRITDKQGQLLKIERLVKAMR